MKVKLLWITGDRNYCFDCGHQDIDWKISEWDEISEEDYLYLSRHLQDLEGRHEYERPLLIRYPDPVKEPEKTPVKLASQLVKEEKEKEKKRLESQSKRQKTISEKKKQKEIKKLQELQAKYGTTI